MKSLFRGLTAGTLLAALAAGAAASLLDDEIRVGRDLQARLQTAIDVVLGEHKSSVLVNVQLDLTEEMKARLNDALAKAGAAPAVTAETARWLAPPAASSSSENALPGFPSRSPKSASPTTVIAVNAAPAAPAWDPVVILAAGVTVKRITIKVLLDKSLPAGAEDTVKAVVANFVDLVPARGDAFRVSRVRMPTMLEEALRNPELMGTVLQKAATLGVVLLMAAGFFVLGLVTLSTVRRSVDRLALAVHTLKPLEDAAFTGNNALPGGGAPPALEGPARTAPPAAASSLDAPDPHRVLFDVPVEKVSYLMEYLANEELDRVVLVVQHLPPAAKSAFLGQLSPGQAGEVVMAMSQTSVTDPETLDRLKEDIERHVRGSSGGVPAVVEMIHAANPLMRRQLLDAIAKKDPALGGLVRERVFFFEDLARLTQEELSKIISQVQLNDLALALVRQPPEVADRVKAVLPKLSWKVLEEESEHRGAATDEKVGQAQDRVIQVVYRFVRDGHVVPTFFHLPAHLRGAPR